MIKEYLGACFILVTVFTFGYILAERFIPKTNKAFNVFIISNFAVGLSLLFIFPESIRLKALAFSIAWLGVIWINKKRKLPDSQEVNSKTGKAEVSIPDNKPQSESKNITQE